MPKPLPPADPNRRTKVMAEITELARIEAPAAIKRLAWLRDHAQSEQVQAYCAEALLNRGYGRPPQVIGVTHAPRVIVVALTEKVIEHEPGE